MAAGFEVYNEAGKLQVYEGAPALHYVSKGLVTTAASQSMSSVSSVSIDVPTSVAVPIIATRSFGAVAPYYSSNLGNGFIRYVYNTDMAIGAKVAYYIFDLASSITPTNFGLEIYQTNGTLAFSSNVPAATMIGAVGAGSISLTNGRLYAVIITGYGGYLTQEEQLNGETGSGRYSQDGFQYGGKITVTSSTYAASQVLVDYMSIRRPAWGSYIGNWNVPARAMLVVDVTALGAIAGEETYVINMSPNAQQVTGGTSTGTFAASTIEKNGAGGNVTGYNWRFANAVNGTWSVLSGQGTTSAVARVTGAPVYTGTNLAEAQFICDVTVDGAVKSRIASLSYVYNSGVTVTLAGLPQEASAINTSWTFGSIGIGVAGGTPTSYTWSVSGYGAAWTILSGQGTANVQVRAASVPQGGFAGATVSCAVVVNGVTHTRSGSLSYTNTLTGN